MTKKAKKPDLYQSVETLKDIVTKDLAMVVHTVEKQNTQLKFLEMNLLVLKNRFDRGVFNKAFRWSMTLLKHIIPFVRVRHEFDLYPFAMVHKGSINRMHWVSVGEDPAFLLIPSKGKYPKGWIFLDFRVKLNGSDFTPKIYIDYGLGFNESDAVSIPISKKGTIKHFCRLDKGIKALRFDPMQCPGDFFVDKFIAQEVGWCERLARMTQRVLPYMNQKVQANNGKPYGLAGIISNLKKAYFEISRERSYKPPVSSVYEHWITHFDTLHDHDRAAIENRIGRFNLKPVISIVMPVYNTEEKYLRRALDSVVEQLYPYWELCIADDASTKSHVKEVLSEYEKKDSRIKVVYRRENGHISEASNSALSVAQGAFIALMDHDDDLPEKALYRIAEEINKYPEAEIIYSDEDKIDIEGRRFSPHFKSDWNPELFFSQNYISHLAVYEAGLIRSAGGFRKGYEGSQDYDLTLRCVALTQANRIRHIPEILYHWRSVPGSTAFCAEEKNYAYTAGKMALQDFFESQGRRVSIAEGSMPGTYRISYSIPSPSPLVSLLIPTYNNCEMLKKCIDSIVEKTTYNNYEIIIINNRSDDRKTLEYLGQFREGQKIRVIDYNKPFNFSALNNFAVQFAEGEIIGLINNDIEVITAEWLEEMVSYAVNPAIGAVGAKLLYNDGRVQHAGVILGLGGVAGHSHKFISKEDNGYFCRAIVPQALSAVTAACLLVRKQVYAEVQGLDEQNLAVAFNDVDFGLKLREAGYRNVWTPHAVLYHHESVSRGYEDTPEKQERFQREVKFMQAKWGKILKQDPYYNPNLTLSREDFSIA